MRGRSVCACKTTNGFDYILENRRWTLAMRTCLGRKELFSGFLHGRCSNIREEGRNAYQRQPFCYFHQGGGKHNTGSFHIIEECPTLKSALPLDCSPYIFNTIRFQHSPRISLSTMTFGSSVDREKQLAGRHRKNRASSNTSQTNQPSQYGQFSASTTNLNPMHYGLGPPNQQPLQEHAQSNTSSAYSLRRPTLPDTYFPSAPSVPPLMYSTFGYNQSTASTSQTSLHSALPPPDQQPLREYAQSNASSAPPLPQTVQQNMYYQNAPSVPPPMYSTLGYNQSTAFMPSPAYGTPNLSGHVHPNPPAWHTQLPPLANDLGSLTPQQMHAQLQAQRIHAQNAWVQQRMLHQRRQTEHMSNVLHGNPESPNVASPLVPPPGSVQLLSGPIHPNYRPPPNHTNFRQATTNRLSSFALPFPAVSPHLPRSSSAPTLAALQPQIPAQPAIASNRPRPPHPVISRIPAPGAAVGPQKRTIERVIAPSGPQTYSISCSAALLTLYVFSCLGFSSILPQFADSPLFRYFSNGGGNSASSGSRSSLNKIFDSYREDVAGAPDAVGTEGTMKYMGDLGANLEDLDALAVLEAVQAPAMGEMSREGFVDGWTALK
jgi:hypothetical protein